uniref:Uncharacterized protein n=1 Tax=Echeneis naucrates TaxID=173247 RepID=A0A665VBC6_ECHNA
MFVAHRQKQTVNLPQQVGGGSGCKEVALQQHSDVTTQNKKTTVRSKLPEAATHNATGQQAPPV